MADRMEPRAEITSADVDRVDAVDEPATGIPFLVLKTQNAAEGATDPAFVNGGAIPSGTATVRQELAKGEAVISADDARERFGLPVVKAADEEREDTAHAGGETIDPASDDAYVIPGGAAWEALDADNARYATANLLAVREVISALIDREQTEAATTEDGDDLDNLWNLDDALGAIDCAVGLLATFAATEQQEADNEAAKAEAQARALGLIKTLFPNKEEEPAMATPTKAELLKSLETDLITKAQESGIEDATLGSLFIRKAQNDDLPTGVIDLLNQIVAVMNAIDTVSTGADEAAESPVDTGEGEEPAEAAPSQPDATGPVEDALTPADASATPDAPADTVEHDTELKDAAAPAEATDDDDKPNPFAKSAEAPAELGADVPGSPAAIQAAEARRAQVRKAQEAALAAQTAQRDAALLGAVDEHRAAHHLPPVAIAKGQEKTLEDRIAEAVAAAVTAATAPLQKRISELEETPVDTGVLLSGHVPGTPAVNSGQGATAGPAKADLLKSAATSGDLGKQTDAVLDAIKAIHRGEHV